MNSRQLRAFANFIRGTHGADAFLARLGEARRLSRSGRLESGTIWNRIAEEISLIETSGRLERCLNRSKEQAGPSRV